MIVGLIGCGQWGAHVLRDLRSLGCDVPVLARSDASVARARVGGAAMVVLRMAELCTVDALVVVTPIVTHAAVVDEALELDVPVFVEKPLCDEVEHAKRLALAPGRLFVMDKWRYHPGVRALAEIARTGRLGRTHGLRTIRVQPDNRHEEDAIWVLAPHDLAIALEVLGEVPGPVAAAGSWTGETARDVARTPRVGSRLARSRDVRAGPRGRAPHRAPLRRRAGRTPRARPRADEAP